MTVVTRMCILVQSEDLYETKHSMLMNFACIVIGGEKISFHVAACEHDLRRLSRIRDLCPECT